jgi:hypothetical protein
MRADPEPQQPVVDFDRERTITKSDTYRPVTADLLQLQGRVARILFQERIVLVGRGATAAGR